MLRPGTLKRVHASEIERIHRKRARLDLTAHFVIPPLLNTIPKYNDEKILQKLKLPLYDYQLRSLYLMHKLEKDPYVNLGKN